MASAFYTEASHTRIHISTTVRTENKTEEQGAGGPGAGPDCLFSFFPSSCFVSCSLPLLQIVTHLCDSCSAKGDILHNLYLLASFWADLVGINRL